MCSAIVYGIVTGDTLVSYWPIFYFLQLALDKRRSERLPTVHCDCVSDKMAEFSIARRVFTVFLWHFYRVRILTRSK